MIFTSFIGTKFIGTNFFFNCGSTVKPIQNRGHKRDFRITGTERSETETSLALHDWLVPSTISTPQKQTNKSYTKLSNFNSKFTNP